MYTTSQIATIINASFLQQQEDVIVEHLLLDSRKLLFAKTTLFFALGNNRRSGNLFLSELYEKGVRNFVVDDTLLKETVQNFPDANVLLVKNVLQSLQLLVTEHRKEFNLPVIGITGSNGKTIVKEWLYQLLQPEYNIVRSPKSYNSQIGVPLSVWQMNSNHTLGIFEAGISQPDEMQQLEKMIAPAIAVFTNIGDAHSEGFLNIRQKINEKLRLFVNSKLLIYGADNPELHAAVIEFSTRVKSNNDIQLFSWGANTSNDLQIIKIERLKNFTKITAKKKAANSVDAILQFNIPFVDEASIENTINCCCVLLHLNYSNEQIAERMLQLRSVEMRLELKKGINNCTLINDSYNADINSLTIALDFLAQQQQHPNRSLFLSDILQTGKSYDQLYGNIAAILLQKNINRIIGIGPEIFKQQAAFSGIKQSSFFSSIADFKQQFNTLHFYNETILLKGARVFEFEQISHLLEEKVHQTVLEIDLSAITHNLKAYQQLLQPGVKLMAMVKAFSYGSGSFEIANLLQFHKVDYLAVAYADEGVELRKAGISLPIMVMSPEIATFDVLLQYDLEPELYSFNILQSFQKYLEEAGIENYPVHIKLDTGMHRLGFEEQDIDPLKNLLKICTKLKIQSVFSHLVASDTENLDAFTNAQFVKFNNCCDALQEAVAYKFMRHIANTSAIARHNNLQLDLVRLGIGLYGVDSAEAMQGTLKNVTTLKTTIAQIRKVNAGESVGYNRSEVMQQDSMIATVRIGYADGYPRNLGNGKGQMLLNGKLVKVVGNVCMDMTMLNISGMDAKEGDEVIVFGKNLAVTQVAQWAGTIAYEILTGISQRVKRVYYEE